MRLSTRTTYGIRAMLALAKEYDSKRPLAVKDIAEQQGIPATFLEQVMVPLRKANFVSATRGAHGGCMLARPPQEITVAEIVELLEGPLLLAGCPPGGTCCWAPENCALNDLWTEASQNLISLLHSVSLSTLIERQAIKDSVAVLTYCI